MHKEEGIQLERHRVVATKVGEVMLREELIGLERERCRAIAARVVDLVSRGWWDGPEWTPRRAIDNAADMIGQCIEQGIDPCDVDRFILRIRGYP